MDHLNQRISSTSIENFLLNLFLPLCLFFEVHPCSLELVLQLFLDDLLMIHPKQCGFLAIQDGTSMCRSHFFMLVDCDPLKNAFRDGPFFTLVKSILPQKANILAFAGRSFFKTEEEPVMVELVLGWGSKGDVSGLAMRWSFGVIAGERSMVLKAGIESLIEESADEEDLVGDMEQLARF